MPPKAALTGIRPNVVKHKKKKQFSAGTPLGTNQTPSGVISNPSAAPFKHIIDENDPAARPYDKSPFLSAVFRSKWQKCGKTGRKCKCKKPTLSSVLKHSASYV